MKKFKKFLYESRSELDSLLYDKKYFDIAYECYENEANENELELYPGEGEEFDPNKFLFYSKDDMEDRIYDVLGSIEISIEEHMEGGKVVIYRGLSTNEMKTRVYKQNFEWESWSLNERTAMSFSGYTKEMIKKKGSVSWLMVGLVDLKDIDYELIVNRWVNFPEEYEIPVKNPMNVEIIEIRDLDNSKVYKQIDVDKEKNEIMYSN